MSRAMFAGVSGIRAQQVRMDVIGNNIANVNTVGFKASRVVFQDLFSQLIGASGDGSPMQVGLGVGVGAVGQNQDAGSLQATGRSLDLAIQGQGYFILRSGQRLLYTRAGSFDWDSQGYLVNPATGQRVQGWLARPDGTFDPLDPGALADIRAPFGETVPAQPTTRAAFGGNLDAAAPESTTDPQSGATVSYSYTTGLSVYDSQGRVHQLKVTFTRDKGNTWNYEIKVPEGLQVTSGDKGTLNFNPDGTLAGVVGADPQNPTVATLELKVPNANDLKVTLDFTRLTQTYAGADGSTAAVREVNGSAAGTLEAVTIDPEGQVTGIYSNGARKLLARIATATFPNPSGLSREGGGFAETAASGRADVAPPGARGHGRLAPGSLEMANVDLAQEFTNLILTQRALQANARVVTAADEMLQDLVNLRR